VRRTRATILTREGVSRCSRRRVALPYWRAARTPTGRSASSKRVSRNRTGTIRRCHCPTLEVLQLDNLSGAYPPGFSREEFVPVFFDLQGRAARTPTGRSASSKRVSRNRTGTIRRCQHPRNSALRGPAQLSRSSSSTIFREPIHRASLERNSCLFCTGELLVRQPGEVRRPSGCLEIVQERFGGVSILGIDVVLKGSTTTAYKIDVVWKELEIVANHMRQEEECSYANREKCVVQAGVSKSYRNDSAVSASSE
jgi:hypothetical protein